MGLASLEDVILTLAIDFMVTLGWILITRRRWQIGALLLPAAALTIAGYMVFITGPITTGVVQLVLAVILAGMLSGNAARWATVVLSGLVYLGSGWASGGLDLETITTTGTLLFVTLVVVALLERFFTDQLDISLKAVREREAKLGSIFRAAPIGIGIVVERVIHEANPTLCQMTGYAREELIGKSSRVLYPTQEEYEYVGTEKYRQIHAGDVGTVETRWLRKNGEICDILLSSVPLEPEDLSRGVTFTALDITERKKTEAALRESEALYHDLVDTAQDLIWQCDQMGRYIYLNPAWEDVLGYKLAEMMGRPFTDFQSPEYSEQDMQILSFLLEGNSVSQYETVHLAKDGSELQLVFNAKAVCDVHGEVIGIRGTAYDITDRKKAELALKKSEYLLQESQKLARLGYYELDIASWAWKSSDGLNEIFGVDWDYSSTIDGWLDLIYPDDREEMNAYFAQEVVNKQQSFDKEYRIVRRSDGAVRWVHSLGKLELDSDGNPVIMIGNVQDITERKNTEIALRDSAKRYQAVVEDQTEFIVRWKPDGMRTFVNEAYLRYFNLSRDEAYSFELMSHIVEEDRPAIEEKMPRLVTGKVVSETDVHRVFKPDGSIGWHEWTHRAISDEDGNIIELQSVGRDITESKQANEALRLRTEELEALFSISSHLRSAPTADAMLPVVLAEMRRVLYSDANAIILFDPGSECFSYALGDGSLSANDGLKFSATGSISGMVFRTRQPYIAKDLSSDPNKTSALKGDQDLGPAIIVPVVSEDEFLGVLLCARKKDGDSREYLVSDGRLLSAMGEMVGNALRRARLFDQAIKRMQHLQTLHSIDTAISANLDLGVILDILLSQGVAQLDVDAACVLLLDTHTHMLVYAAGKGFHSKEIKSTRLRLGEGMPGRAVIDRKVMRVPDLQSESGVVRKYLLDQGFVSYQVAPLIAKGQLQGALEIFNLRPMDGGEEQTGFLETLATQAAIAIDNSQLFSDLQRSNFELEMAYDATIEGWSRALELRDLETEGHTLRVTDMTLQLAQEIGVRSSEMIHVRRGSLLHDIGKMGVPDKILLKPGKLDDDEWKVMKQHTVYAFELLWPIEFLRPALDIPYCHHERWDGTGYPRQLKGEHIPLSARLFAIVDVWDALTNDRPYRKAWSEERALEYIASNRGKHFDPRIADLFLELWNKGGKVGTF